ncbi:ABC transporter ATP-binding protein [Ureibacillus manganicus]|uniref:ABC transporter ATP-binding protein n=1 Tax=Ureibacillus manganicus TaxID=1266064 RepID=UPI000691F3A0|nr:sn-glycerol-3-phosphate ABC transporter ATP-binding protein UgpC [Ureibacillus manganicus]
MAKIELKHMYKDYVEGVHAVTDFDLTIENEEFIVLVGPSGCGKSTTLRMIAGLEDISSGEIYIDGKKQNNLHPKDRDIAMVFQNYALYPHMNVYDNMAFGLKMRKTPKEEIDRRVKNAARILDIEQLLERKPKELSGGQRQRVALGRAIVREAKVFLMDEPLSNLDAKLRFQTRAEITKLHRNLKATTIYVTHDQTEAMSMATRIVVMKDGLIQQIGTPKEIYTKPANVFVGKFIGSPAMNFINTTVKENRIKIGEHSFELPKTVQEKLKSQGYSNKDMLLGIRPEDLELVHEEKKDLTISVQVELSELMGAETLVYFKIQNETIISKINSMDQFEAGQKVQFGINFDQIHFFDRDTELRVPTLDETLTNQKTKDKDRFTA